MFRQVFSRVGRAKRHRTTLRHRYFEALESRTLLSTTVAVTGSTLDQRIASDGSAEWVNQTAARVGDNGTNASEVAAIFPFLLPSLPSGAVITSASVSFYLNMVGNASSLVGTADVYGLGARSTGNVQASDFFEGAYGTDSTDATAIQQSLADKNTAVGNLTLSGSGANNLKNYLSAQYAGGAAGKYAFLRISSSDAQQVARYWVFNTADNASGKPVLTITYEVTPADPTNLKLTTTSNSAIQLNWQDNSVNETGFAVERSTNGTTWSAVATTAANATSYVDSGLAADTKYFYRVFATNGGANSNKTTVQSDTTLPTFTHTLWVDAAYAGTTKNGGFATPYSTIQAAINASVSGDGIVLRGGTYFERPSLKGGTTLMSTPNELAVISGFTRINGWTQYSGNIYSTTVNFNPTTLFVGETQQGMASSPDSSWWVAPTVTHGVDANGYSYTVISDPAHLAGIPSLVGGTLQVHTGADNNYSTATISAHDTVNGTITVVGTSLTNTYANNMPQLVNGDDYMVKNKLELLNKAGEWVVTPGTTAGTYTLYFWPKTLGDLSNTQSRTASSGQVVVSTSNVTVRGIEVTGNTGIGISVGNNASNVTIRDCIVVNNGGNGINTRYVSNIHILNNIVWENGNGIAVGSATHVVVSGNDVAYNMIDGIDISGDTSGKQPGDAGFTPSSDIIIDGNYIHDNIAWGHADGIQMYNWVSDLHILNNVIIRNMQGIMSQDVDGAELGNNIIWDTGAISVIFGHGTSVNWNVHNNTIGGSGWGPVSLTATGYTFKDNIFLGRSTAVPDTTIYQGDYNFFASWDGYVAGGKLGSTYYLYKTVAALYAGTGQDQHSLQGDPQFVNAPIVSTMVVGDVTRNTTTMLYVAAVTGFAVGDHIEVNGDGVVRTITAIDTVNKTITFDVPLSSKPMTQTTLINDWKTKTDYTLDFSLAAGSPAATGSSTGGPMGSTLNIQSYISGDFNGDGVRDIPIVPADVLAGIPDQLNWRPPTY